MIGSRKSCSELPSIHNSDDRVIHTGLVDLDEPTKFLDRVHVGCTQRQCKPNEIIIMFEPRTSNGATEKLLGCEKPHAKTVAWSYDMEGHAQKCVEKILRTGKQKDGATVRSLKSLDDHRFKKEELGSIGKLTKVCSQIVLKCMYLARVGRPDILWSVSHQVDTSL